MTPWEGNGMSNINLNDFWNKVREDIEATLPKEILESTIIRLLPLQLDEISKTLTLTTMQTYIKDFIENEPMIKNAFQNSVQCNVATMMPDIMDAQPSLAEVQPGGTITLECAYSLQDTANPITVQVGPLMSITNEVNAQMTFSFKNN